MDTAGPSFGLLTAAVCYSGLEMLQRKATKKSQGQAGTSNLPGAFFFPT